MSLKKIQRQSMTEIVIPTLRKCCLLSLIFITSGCSESELPVNYQLSADMLATYDRSCKTCHEIPATGAPQTGNSAQWAPRFAQGMEALVNATLEGKGNMPPLGQCFECNKEQFEQLILFLSSKQENNSPE